MKSIRLPALILALVFTGVAQAHPGHGDPAFLAGLLHPVTGLDHVLAVAGYGGAVAAASVWQLA